MMLTGLILGAVGVLLAVVGAVTGMRLRRFLRSAASAQGKVVGFVKQTSSGDDGGSSTHAMVEFATADGATVTFTEKSQTFGGLSVGSAVPVKYDPSAPGKARIATSGRLWVTSIVLVSVGAALLVVGVILAASGD